MTNGPVDLPRFIGIRTIATEHAISRDTAGSQLILASAIHIRVLNYHCEW